MTFAATCDDVAAMLINPAFAEHVGKEIQALTVAVRPIEQGLAADFTLAAPDSARRIIGSQITVTELVTWQKPSADGTRVGRMTITLAGMPAESDGPLRLNPTDGGTDMVYDTNFTVKIPLVGKRLEEMTAKYLTQIIEACEKVGNDWLSSNRHP